MAKTIVASNQKGGVGKSTTAAILAEIEACVDQTVLLFDLEPQTNVTMLFSENNYGVRHLTTADLFQGDYTKRELMDSIMETPYKNIYLFPGSLDLYNIPDKLSSRYIAKYIKETGNHDENYLYNRLKKDEDLKSILKKQLIKIQSEFDYIIMDTNPFKTIMNTNALCAADAVLIPVETDGYSYQGLSPLLDTYEEVTSNPQLNPTLPLPKIFITRSSKRTTIYKEFYEQLGDNFGEGFCKTAIANDTKIKEATAELIPPLHYAPKSKACTDYIELFKETGLLTQAQYKKLTASYIIQKIRADR